MSDETEWSPDEAQGTESYSSWDEALDEQDVLAPDRPGNPEGERSLDRQLGADESELSEVGATFDDPEALAVLDGGIDDPDGSGLRRRGDPDDGWDLDAGEDDGVDDEEDGAAEGAGGADVGVEDL